MKKLVLILFLALFSCSNECEYGGDRERRENLLEEIEELEEKRDNAPNETQADIYQADIDRKQDELTEELKRCV